MAATAQSKCIPLIVQQTQQKIRQKQKRGQTKRCASSLPRSVSIVVVVVVGLDEEEEEKEEAAGVDEDEDRDREFEFAKEDEEKEEEGIFGRREEADVRGVMDEPIDSDDIEGKVTLLFWRG